MDLRFDDSLGTVLAAESLSPAGAHSAWRQLVDLIGRGRVPADAPALERLRALRGDVPMAVRAASVRALAGATPPAALVALFAEDEIAVAAPLLRSVALDPDSWRGLLPAMSPAARAVLRHRRDLAPPVRATLDHYGAVDFVLGAPDGDGDAAPGHAEVATPVSRDQHEADPSSRDATLAAETSFVSIATVAAGLPVVAEALRRAEPEAPANDGGAFRIADLVARIDAYQRRREAEPASFRPEIQPELFARDAPRAERFRFETDASGTLRHVDGAESAALVGLSFARIGGAEDARIDGTAHGAYRGRAAFADARLSVAGHSDAAGEWRISATPAFDPANGRFTGYRGTARRPRRDEDPAPRADTGPSANALRQLVHELRTPAGAIAGFAEMIDAQLLGPVPAAYQAQARVIRQETAALLGAIEDLELAARIEANALDLRADTVPVAALLARIVHDLEPLARLRGAAIACGVPDDAPDHALAVRGDVRAVERLVERLVAALTAAAGRGERIEIVAARADAAVAIRVSRPAALLDYPTDALLTIDAEAEAERGGAPLLGTGFALRLARNLASELGGSLAIEPTRLTLRLPAAEAAAMEQASSN